MKRFNKANFFILLFLLAIPSVVRGQSNSSYKIEKWILAGGGVDGTSASLKLNSSILGQGSVRGNIIVGVLLPSGRLPEKTNSYRDFAKRW